MIEFIVEKAIEVFGKKLIEALKDKKEQDAQNEIQKILGPGCYFKEKTVMLSDKALKTLTEHMREKGILITLAREDNLPKKFEKGCEEFKLEGYRFQWGTLIVIAKQMTEKEVNHGSRCKAKGEGQG